MPLRSEVLKRSAFSSFGVPYSGTYTHILDSADPRFGGMGTGIPEKIKAEAGLCDYKDYSISFDLPPYAAEVFLFQDPSKKDTMVRSERAPRTLRSASHSEDSDGKETDKSKAVKKFEKRLELFVRSGLFLFNLN